MASLSQDEEETSLDGCRPEFLVGKLSDTYRYINLVVFILGCVGALVCFVIWVRNMDRAYLRVRGLAYLLLETFSFLLFLYVFPLWTFFLDKERVINECFAVSVPWGLALCLYETNVILRYQKLYKQHALLIKITEQFSSQKSTDHANDLSLASLGLVRPGRPITEKAPSALDRNILKNVYGSKPCWKQCSYWTVLIGLNVAASFLFGFCFCTVVEWVKGECSYGTTFRIIATASAVSIVIQMLYALYIGSKVPSLSGTFGLRDQFVKSIKFDTITLAPGFIFMLVYEPGVNELGFDHTFLLTAGIICNYFYQVPYQLYLALSRPEDFYDLKLDDVFGNPVLNKVLGQHLYTEYSESNLNFLSAVQDYRDNLNDPKKSDSTKIARNIQRRFLSPESISQVNVSHGERAKFEKMMNNTTPTPANLFDGLEAEVYMLVKNDSWRRFTSMPLYKWYMGLPADIDL